MAHGVSLGPMPISIEVLEELSTSFGKQFGCCNLAESCSQVVAFKLSRCFTQANGRARKNQLGAYFINISPCKVAWFFCSI